MVTLEWTQNDPLALYSFYVNITPPIQPISHFNETSSVVVNMSYNVAYNVTILIRENRCMENVTLISQSFYYRKYNVYIFDIRYSVQSCFDLYNYFIAYCRDPSRQINDTIKVFDYIEDSAIAGSSVTFGCSLPGHTLIGSNISICTSSGEWEPDPREATDCKGEMRNGKSIIIRLLSGLYQAPGSFPVY